MNFLISQTIRVLILTTISFIIALVLAPIWSGLLKKWKFGKHMRGAEEGAPVFHELHKKKEGTPNSGGVIIWGTVAILAAFFGIMGHFFDGPWHYFNFISRSETYLPIVALLAAALLGFLDDWLAVQRLGGGKGGGIQVRQKAILYLLIAAVGAWWFYVRLGWNVLYVPFFGNVTVGWWYIPIFIFVVFATAFSANETDGLDGLLGGVSLFAFLALAVVAFVLHRYDLAAFDGLMIGALLAFLWHNIFPAKFFMGDTGSMALGVTIAVIAMLTNTALFLPLFGFILVIESLSVIIQVISKKLRHGKKVFRSAPIHHHFEALGWPESQVTMRFWIVSALTCALGLVLFFIFRAM